MIALVANFQRFLDNFFLLPSQIVCHKQFDTQKLHFLSNFKTLKELRKKLMNYFITHVYV